MKHYNKILVGCVIASSVALTGCTEDSPITNPPVNHEKVEIVRGSFAKGADVSWLTELEKEGYVFYDANHQEKECMELLRDECGVDAIRLRVWVNPETGWNSIEDVVVKARRAHNLGLRLMIDFHFSDTWADPGNQITPAAWADYDLDKLKEAVTSHVTEMLGKLKALNIEPEWVQIGNETRNGMLHPLGNYQNGGNFAELVNSGYDATKAVFPDCAVIIHLDSGNRLDLYTRIFNNLATYGGKYDMIGMSLYPDESNWETIVQSCVDNINSVAKTYGKPVMICEVGMKYDIPEVANKMMTKLRSLCETSTNGQCKGIFYWEPEAPAGYNGGYDKGCFIDGSPTEALDCFKN